MNGSDSVQSHTPMHAGEGRVYNDPPIGIPGLEIDRPVTYLEDHIKQLSILSDGLERALMQYENMLRELRGPVPEGPSNPNERGVGSTESKLGHIGTRMECLHDLCSKLNNAADELNGIL